MSEFSKAIERDPSSAEAHAARGIERYPSADSVHDLESAVRLGCSSYWPAYYLAHHCVLEQQWQSSTEYAGAALILDPPDGVRANLLEWRAIARFQLGDDIAVAQADMEKALDLAPDKPRLRRNLELLARLQPPAPVPWVVERDVRGDPADARAA